MLAELLIPTLGGVAFGSFMYAKELLKDNNVKSNIKTKEQWQEFLSCIDITNKAKNGIAFVEQNDNFILFRCPYGISEQDIKSKEVYFLKFLNVTKIEYEIKDIWLKMTTYKEELSTLVPFEIIESKTKDIEVYLGETYSGHAKINFNNTPHVLLSGATNSGKSVLTHSILVQLYLCQKNIKFYLADMKKVELINYKNLPTTLRYEDTLEGVSDMITELLEECDRRYELIGSLGCKKMETYNTKVEPQNKLYPIVFVIEECVRLISDKQTQKDLAELLFIARACGIYIILTIQRPTRSCLSPEIKASLGNIIGLKTVNKKNSECICDDDRLSSLRGFGHGWLFNDYGQTEFQSFYIEEDKIDEYLKCLKPTN